MFYDQIIDNNTDTLLMTIGETKTLLRRKELTPVEKARNDKREAKIKEMNEKMENYSYKI